MSGIAEYVVSLVDKVSGPAKAAARATAGLQQSIAAVVKSKVADIKVPSVADAIQKSMPKGFGALDGVVDSGIGKFEGFVVGVRGALDKVYAMTRSGASYVQDSFGKVTSSIGRFAGKAATSISAYTEPIMSTIRSKWDRVVAAVEPLRPEIDMAKRAMAALGPVGAKIGSAFSSLGGLSGSLGSIGSIGMPILGGIASGLGSIVTAAAAVVAGIGAIGVGLGAMGASYAAEMGKFKSDMLFSLRAVTKTQEGAGQLFDRIDKLARASGQSTTKMSESVRELMLGGFDDKSALALTAGFADLKAINPSANIGTLSQQIAQMKGAGKVSMEDLKPILNAGVQDDLFYEKLREITGEKDQSALKKAISAGKVTSDQGIAAILASIQGTGEKYGTDGALGAVSAQKQASTVSGAIDQVKNNFERLFMSIQQGDANSGIAKLAQKFAQFLDPDSQEGSQLLATLDSVAVAVGDIVGYVADQNFSEMFDKAMPVVRQLGNILNNTIVPAVKAFASGFGDGFSKAIGPLGEVVSKLLGLGDAGEGASTVVTAMSGIGKALGLIAGITATAITAVTVAVGTITAFVGEFFDAGYNLAAGLTEGITSGIASVIESVSNLGSSAISTLRSVLRIQSPSRVMAELGGYTAEGFAGGIEDGAGRVDAAMSDLAQTPAVTALGLASMSAASGQSGSRGTITINVDASGASDPGAIKAAAEAGVLAALEAYAMQLGSMSAVST